MAIDMQAVHILAKQAALRVVKRKLQAEGKVKPSLVPAGRLGILANEYLQAHPELFAQAIQSDLVQISPVPHKRRKLDPQRELLCESRDRIGG